MRNKGKSDAFLPLADTADAEEGDLLAYERALCEKGCVHIAGIDEVGRGALAGPLVVTGVILALDDIPEGIDDSKALTSKKREHIAERIRACALAIHTVFIPPETIDALNIYEATRYAMGKVATELSPTPDHLLIDAMRLPAITIPQTSIVKGDARSVSIAAASIIAKVARDAYMRDLSLEYPAYGWDENKGYGAKKHMTALAEHGATPHHRTSFAPVREVGSNETGLF